MHKKQQGGSLALTMVLVALLVFLVVTGFRVFPVYMEYFTISSTLSDVAERPGGKTKTVRQLWNEAAPGFQINMVDSITIDNLSVFDDEGSRFLGLEYEVRTGLIGNIDAVIMFERRFELAN